MRAAKQKTSERISRAQVDKFSERREELARAALKTLSELGYARTSLREIAENTEFSHGVLHYYFTDKVDLIMCCVRQYKAVCVQRYDEVVTSAKTADELAKGFAQKMSQTLRDEATLHRLWYDLRTQSLFDASFREDVAAIDQSLERMIWRIVTEYARLREAELTMPSMLTYALFDGLFQKCLLKLLHGDANAPVELAEQVERALAQLPLQPKQVVKAPRRRDGAKRGRVSAA